MANTPVTYPSDLTYVGLASERGAQGTPQPPTATLLLTKDPACKDNQLYLDDTGLRQSMSETYGEVLGPLSGDCQLDGDFRCDTGGFLLGNIMGDYTMTGTAIPVTTTLSSTANVGATQFSATASIPGGSTIQVGTGLTAEVFVTNAPSGAGPYTIPINVTSGAQGNGTTVFQHLSGAAITVIGTPYTYKFSEQCAGVTGANALLAQAHSLSITDWYGPTAVTGARVYPGSMLSDLTLTLDPSKLVTFSAKAMSWGSSAASSTPGVIVSSLPPLAGWNLLTGIGGPASGGTLVNNIENLTLTLSRKLKLYPTLGQAQPFIIRQGKFGMSGKFTVITANETALTNYLTNVQPQLQFVLNSGSGATTQNLQIDMQQVAYNAVQPVRTDEAVKLEVSFKAIANTTNVGSSGGFSPGMITLGNAMAVGSY
jgi:hypothetical protein